MRQTAFSVNFADIFAKLLAISFGIVFIFFPKTAELLTVNLATFVLMLLFFCIGCWDFDYAWNKSKKRHEYITSVACIIIGIILFFRFYPAID